MAELIVVYWRDIPAQVIARTGRRNQVKIELDERFAKAIDIAAMKGGARGDDAYLADWRKAAPVEVSDDLQGEAEAMARQLEEEYDEARLKALMANGGREG
ncbi:MAG: virulence factor [Alphaproteobacteria bacterium]|nr:virulence factor [Alphaproteobacteria bacterium]